MRKGKVYLVGAGPGDIGLITVRGKELIAKADVILYDNLANSLLLNDAKPNAELIYVGKKANEHIVKQDRIIDLMIEKAESGLNVLRLKGGDIYVFGRGSEEALALNDKGIEFEVVPGITAATGATAYAGIPLTHRKLVTQCVFVTAHEAPDKKEQQVEWEHLAQMKHTTIVIYMGASMISNVVDILIKNGMPEETPAAVIQNGTLPNQRSVSGILKNIPEIIRTNGLTPPLITIISPTIELRDKINWFENRPLSGKKIVVTRAVDQAVELIDKLNSLGAETIHLPVIKTESKKIEDIGTVFEGHHDWVLFTSENGVRYFFEQLNERDLDSRFFSDMKIAAVGSQTAKALKRFGLKADLVPSSYTSATLLQELIDGFEIRGKKFLRIKGYFDNDPLTEGIKKNGGYVNAVSCYELQSNTPTNFQTSKVIDNKIDAVLFTSVSSIDNFYSALGNEAADKVLRSTNPVVIGPVTAKGFAKYGITKFIESKIQTIDGMIKELLELLG